MHIDGAFLRSAVGRRILLYFVLATAIPVVLMALLTYRGVTDLLAQRSIAELGAYSKTYGMNAYGRLKTAAAILRQVRPGRGRDLATPLAARGADGPIFRSIGVVDAHGNLHVHPNPATPAGVPAQVWREAAGADTRAGDQLLAVRETGGGAEMVLALVHETAPGDGRTVGVLDPAYVFEDSEALPALTELCILRAADGAAIRCTRPDLLPVARRALDPGAAGDGALGAWKLQTTTDLEFPPWVIVTLREPGRPMAGEPDIARTYIEVALMSLALAALLSLTQIRRILVPLERLIDATHRVAGGDFSQPIANGAGDEFGELAGAFNTMSARLDGQIKALVMLSAIDQEILAGLEIDRVVERALQRLRTLAPDCRLAIARIAAGAPAGAGVPVWRQQSAHADRRALALDAGAWRELEREGDPDAVHTVAAGAVARRIFDDPVGDCRLIAVFSSKHDCTAVLIAAGAAGAGTLPDAARFDQIRELARRMGVAFDSAERSAELIDRARNDSLTGLPNRLHLHEAIEQRTAPRGGSVAPFSLLFIDLDRFKGINDALGHDAGDHLLVEAAARIRACLGTGDLVARLGGDEFVVLAGAAHAGAASGALAGRIIDTLSQPFRLGPAEVNVGASIGIADYPADGQDRGALIRNADTAMYSAKKQGRGRCVHFHEEMRRAAVQLLTLESDLRAAIESGGIEAHFQPRKRLRDGAVTGAEALARWPLPGGGFIPPDRFIALAEEIGVIETVGEDMLAHAARALAKWRAHGLPVNHVSVNVSTRQLRNPDICARFCDIVRAAGLDPSGIELEITESALAQDLTQARAALERLRHAGFRIALDDFGTGYSSMSYLRNFPIDIIKIDRSFVRDIETSTGARAIAVAIVSLARTLDIRVVAEGVETPEQENLLRDWHCQEGQGFLYAPAMPAAAFEEWVRREGAECESPPEAAPQPGPHAARWQAGGIAPR